jgi:signal transduction histidine kinase
MSYTAGMTAAQPSIWEKRHLPLTEEQWVKSQAMKHVMQSVVQTQVLMFFAMVVMAALLFKQAPTPTLLTWLGINSLLSVARLVLLRGYNHSDQSNDMQQRAVYFQRYAKLAPFNGAIWGSAVYLFVEISAPNIAIFCLIIVLIFGMFSVSNLSAYKRLLNRFIWAYGASLFLAICLHIAAVHALEPITAEIWYLIMVVIFVFMQFRVGARMNSTYIEGLKLQYRNRKLIASLTDQREAALAAVATKNRMLASAAHDMRQPVLALDLYAGWLAEDPSAALEIIPKISTSTKAVINLFDSLFDMSRLTEGQISTNLEMVQLGDLLSSLQTQYEPIATSKKLFLRVRSFEGAVFTDYLLLERILGNLLSNAIKYTESGGVLLACRKAANGNIKIEVWDTGIGIAPDQQTHVFKEFYKSPSNTGTTDGFGLGLAIVTQLTDLIGAKLTLRSRRSRGTVVSVDIGQTI